MDLLLRREATVDGAIPGRLSVNGVFMVFTLERAEVAIPPGRYPVVITPSSRFGRLLPLVEHVPDRTGIRIHPGNTIEDTNGCILVGMAEGLRETVTNSRIGQAMIQGILARALAVGDQVWLTVVPAVETEAA